MIEFIKKSKKIILSSTIFTGINTNIYCGCLCNDNNNPTTSNNNNNNQNPIKQEQIKEDPLKNNQDPTKEKPINVDNLKNIKETLKKFFNSVIENNNNLEENDRAEINITPKIIDSKDNKDDLVKIEKYLNDINNKIINKINEEKEKAKMLKLSDEDLSKIKDLLKKYNITASDDDINKSYNLSYNKGLENCIHLNLKFKYRYWEKQEFSDGNLYFFYNFKNDLLINCEPSINIIYSKELEEKYDCECNANHKNITNKILKENKEYLIKSVYYIRKQDSNFIYGIASDGNYYYFYNKEKNDYIDCGYLRNFSNKCYCCWNLFYNKTGTSNFEEIKKNTTTIDELLKYVKKGEQERKDNILSLVTTD